MNRQLVTKVVRWEAADLEAAKALSWRLSLAEGRTVNQSEVLRRALRAYLVKHSGELGGGE